MTELYLGDPDAIAKQISELVSRARDLGTTSHDKASSAEYKEAVRAYDLALRETVSYMRKVESGAEPYDPGAEQQLSELWSAASVAIATFDPQLANRLFIKGQGWLDPNVWNDERYRGYRIGIDDMRQALMELNEQQHAQAGAKAPAWFQKAGFGFTVLTFLSLSYLLVGPELSSEKVVFNAWMAFCVAASATFLGGTAVSKGTVKLPFMKDSPVKFSAIGGVAVFIVVFLVLTTANR